MKLSAEHRRIGEHVYVWEAYSPEVKTVLSCCAVRCEKELVLIDPIAMAEEGADRLAAEAHPCAVVVTNGNHLRSALWFKQRFGIPICAHALAAPELGISVDQSLSEGDAIAGLVVAEIEGAGAGEIALYSPDRSWHLGDAIINVEPYGFALLPEKYCVDPVKMRASLQKLLQRPFSLLTFAHGQPLVAVERERLASLLV